ncbi:NAD(P)/FAD-dependent oxidoreductase [Pontibacter saemangeumensis]|uniref:NAD(P)/FAD-dependent oxidoreductase n=1 Tax=Pontibacter saemangeumensis TaxID=1084525 RepID=A0ABP8LLD5_9BACT
MAGHKKEFDVIIVGGSYAGLSAAMALGRSLRETLVIDSGEPCNRQTPHSHNFLTQDGKTPKEISSLARQQVGQYRTVHFLEGIALAGAKTKSGFEIVTQAGGHLRGRKLIFATGVRDKMPDIPGFAACWGISVIHCPYCHGYEYRHRRTAVMANGDRALHLASLVSNLTGELTVLTNGKADFTDEQTSKLKAHGIPVSEKEVKRIDHLNGYMQQVLFQDGTKLHVDALYASIPFGQHTGIPLSLGCALTEQGYLQVDGAHRTTVPGIFACGDNSSRMRSVANAVSGGNLAGAMANLELAADRF